MFSEELKNKILLILDEDLGFKADQEDADEIIGNLVNYYSVLLKMQEKILNQNNEKGISEKL